MLKGPFLDKNFIGSLDNFEESKVVMLGMPMDSTVSNRPGSRFAPQSIRLESIGIETYSPTFDKDMQDVMFYDAGDLDLPFGNPRRQLDIIQENVREIYNSSKKVLGIGGEHLVTLAEIEAIKDFYGNLAVVQFDAHTDLREAYLGENLTHSGVMKQISKIVGFENIAQIGIRSGEKEEFDLMKKYKTQIFDPSELKKFEGKNIFLTIDLDVLDSSLMRGTGTPEAGGLTYRELLRWLCELKKYNIIGADVVELAPDIDPSKVSTASACTLIREVLMLY
ncbi:MAG: agmatinase [Cyanobacteria bacterium SIG30]|nr:agmatinase [Cyanobacteria bacterium SIG30]